ncbi:MAG TPA: hypothetical protein DCR93_38845 [Cytophagales bacterium]|nr:hypothetical protein [Cytophagales bacterium]
MKQLMLSLALVVFAYVPASADSFSISGTTKDLPDGTMVYLRDYLLGKIIDSTQVINNTFYFDTQLPSYPREILILTAEGSDYRYLWVDNTAMTLDASQTGFREAVVTGSATEDLNHAHRQKVDAIADYDQMVEKEMEFAANHPESIISASILSVYQTFVGKERTQALYQRFTEAVKATAYGQQIEEFLRLAVEPKVGDRYVDFEMADTSGMPVQLSQLEGKVILLEFWASWCGPCRVANPRLIQTYEQYHGQGFEILAVSLDAKKASWTQAIAEDDLPWVHVSELVPQENTATLIYGVSGIPDNFLIGPDDTIIGRSLGSEALAAKLAELLSGPE